MLNCWQAGAALVDVGTYSANDAPNIVWKFSKFQGSDGYPYAGMICLADRGPAQNAGLHELEDGAQYARVS
jgi:hypothetical protein